MHGDQAGDAAALQIFAAHGVAGALWRDHRHVEILARLDQVEVDVEAVGEQQRRAVADVRGDLMLVDAALQLVRGQDHDRVGPGGGGGDGHHLQPLGLGLLGRAGAGAQRHGDVLHPGIAQVQRVGVPLAAIAYDGDLLVQDAGNIGVAVIVDAHDPISGGVRGSRYR